MAKYDGTDLTIEFDNASGTLQDMTQYIDTFNGLNITTEAQDVAVFGDTWRMKAAVGLKEGQDITIGGLYDDTASTGPHAIFNDVSNTATTGVTRTLKITWDGTLYSSMETIITSYNRVPAVGENTRYEVTLAITGTITDA